MSSIVTEAIKTLLFIYSFISTNFKKEKKAEIQFLTNIKKNLAH